jgi:transcriptional regulator with XRE-family HTH domain
MFSDWVARAIAHGKMTQAELARRLTARLGRQVDSAAVNKIVKGTRALAADELLAIAELTGHPVLISLEGDEMPDHPKEGFNEDYLVRLLSVALEWRGLPADKARNLSAALVGAARTHPDRQDTELSEDQARQIVSALASAFGIPPQK